MLAVRLPCKKQTLGSAGSREEEETPKSESDAKVRIKFMAKEGRASHVIRGILPEAILFDIMIPKRTTCKYRCRIKGGHQVTQMLQAKPGRSGK